MKHLETINIRCFNSDIEGLLKQYIAPILQSEDIRRFLDVKAYRHSKLEMEVVLIIENKVGSIVAQKSDIGIMLADSLKSFGIVNHALWDEIEL